MVGADMTMIRFSLTYGEADLLNQLLGGSGSWWWRCLSVVYGGGAIELLADGDGTLTISGSIRANGGDTSIAHAESGGGGSGGTIRLQGGSVSITGSIQVKGGNGLTNTPGGGGQRCD